MAAPRPEREVEVAREIAELLSDVRHQLRSIRGWADRLIERTDGGSHG